MSIHTSRTNGTLQRPLRGVVLGLALAFGVLPASSLVLDTEAHAADEDKGRDGSGVKLRRYEAGSTSAQSDEYARMAQQKRYESIDKLKGLLSKNVGGETKAEMMLRLADLYFQEGRYLYLKEMEAFDQQYEACFNTDGCNPDGLKPNNTASRKWQEKSIKLYEGILKSYPRYARADQATFFLGSAYKDLGMEEQAADAFKKLVKLYPESAYLPDAYVQIGEYYFETKAEPFPALKAYLKASSYKDSDKYAYASYKLGWCYYNVGDYDKGIETMKRVVDYSMNQEQNQSNIQLQDEALKDLVRFFADADQMEEAIAYFTQLGKKELIRATLKRLAAMFYEQGKFERSIDMYRRLILDSPSETDNPGYQVDIIGCYKKMGQREKVLEEINRLRADYGPQSAWAQANASDPEAVKDAQDTIEAQLRKIAVEYHNTAREYEKSRHPETQTVYELARSAYATYLDIFPTGEKVYDVRYAYGELLYKLKDYAGAFDQYMMVVDIDPKGKHSRFCAESAVFAAEEQVKLEGGSKVSMGAVKVTKDTPPQELTAWEQRFVDACLKYATLYPEDKKVKDMIYRSAFMLYQKYRFEEASKSFQAVIAMDPRSKEAVLGANLILDALAIKESWGPLKTTAKTFYDQEGLGSKKFKDEVFLIYQNATFKEVEVAFAADGDKSKAADGFMAFYEEFGHEAENAALALNNAAAYYAQSDRVEDSMKVRHILIDDPNFGPKTKYYYDQIGFLGYDYERIADADKAAFYYEKLWSLYPEEREDVDDEKKADFDAKAADAIYSAAVYRKGLGQWEKAIEDYNQFVTAFPDDPRTPDVKIRIGRIYEEKEKWQEAADVYTAYYKDPPEGAPLEYIYFSRLHAGRAMDKLGKRRERDRIYDDTVKLYTKYVDGGGAPGPHTEFVAEMMYELAQPKLEEYLALKIEGKGRGASQKAEDKALTASLQKKAKALNETELAFTKVVQTGAGEWGLAALVSLGKAYENMAESLRTGAVPFYLTEDQRELYSMAIEDKAYVQDEKAVNAYDLALKKSYELTIYNENTAYATRSLGKLRPDDYPGLNETLLEPRYTSSKSGKKYEFETSL